MADHWRRPLRIQPYARRAQDQVDALRRRVEGFGDRLPLDRAVDVSLIAEVYLDCSLVPLAGLTDRLALKYLHDRQRLNIDGLGASDEHLAGGLYLSSDGARRWIFYEEYDPPARQRFSIAHELGHLLLEAEPTIALMDGPSFVDPVEGSVLSFSRCVPSRVESAQNAGPEVDGRHSSRPAWTEADLREFRANHFATELLMPLLGVRRLLSRAVPVAGIQTDKDLHQLTRTLTEVFQVSGPSAERRLRKDLGIAPRSRDPNADLFD